MKMKSNESLNSKHIPSCRLGPLNFSIVLTLPLFSSHSPMLDENETFQYLKFYGSLGDERDVRKILRNIRTELDLI